MVRVDTVNIGTDVYTIGKNSHMFDSELGYIYQATSEIRMRTLTFNNRPIAEKTYFRVLMHEIVHGIDFNVFFTTSGDENDEAVENSIDLVTLYIIKNMRDIVKNREEQFDHFIKYIELCESNISRVPLLFYAILDFFDSNENLIGQFLEVFEQ